MSDKSFPLPSSLKVVPGTEAAQASHPYYSQFVPEDDGLFWFYNSMHFPEPMHHFDMITAEAAYVAMGAMNTRVHVLPTAKGVDHRIINGRVYIGGVVVTDPDEIAERVAEFTSRANFYYENWEQLYDQWKDKMRALIAEAQALPSPTLPAYEPEATFREGNAVAASHDLLKIYQQQVEGYHRMWHHHFEFLLLGYGAYMTFFGFCKQAFPEISDQAISRMVAGMEAEIFRPDEEVKRLARRAVELISKACWPISTRSARARSGWPIWKSAATRGSTCPAATASTIITAAGTMTCRCLSRRCPAISRRSRRARISNARPSS